MIHNGYKVNTTKPDHLGHRFMLLEDQIVGYVRKVELAHNLVEWELVLPDGVRTRRTLRELRYDVAECPPARSGF